MGKYLDLKVGKSLKLYRYAEGRRQDGQKWGLFSFTPAEQDDKGNTYYGQEYTIFINNINDTDRNFVEGDKVEIANIISVTAEDNSYKDKSGQQRHKRVIRVVVDIVLNNNNNNNNSNSNNKQNNSNNTNNIQIENSSYEMPNF